MTQPKNAFEIFQLLEKSNCGNCGEKTCLAFAGAVFKSRRRLRNAPRLDSQRYRSVFTMIPVSQTHCRSSRALHNLRNSRPMLPPWTYPLPHIAS